MPEPSVSSIAIYQLRVVLCGVSPMVWRRLLVVSTTSIAGLHEVLQNALGWSGLNSNKGTNRCEAREILVVDAKLSGELPYSFYGVEIGAVWWEVIKAKVRFVFLTPSAVKFGVVVFSVVRNDDHATPAIEAAALK